MKKPGSEGRPASARKPASEGRLASARKPASEGRPASARKPASEGNSASARKPASEGNPVPARKSLSEGRPEPEAQPAAGAQRARPRPDDDGGLSLREHTSLWSRPGFLVRRLHQIHVAMFMEELAEDQVTPIQYGLLSILVDLPGIDQFSVAEELGIDRANVADVLKRLESRRLVLRIVDPHNKRRKICLATREGAEFVEKYRSRMQNAQRRLLDPLTAAERASFVELLHKLIDANNVFGRATLRPSRGAQRERSRTPPERKPGRTSSKGAD